MWLQWNLLLVCVGVSFLIYLDTFHASGRKLSYMMLACLCCKVGLCVSSE